MKRVKLIDIVRLLGQHPTLKAEVVPLFFPDDCGRFSLQFAQQGSGNGA